MIDLRSDTCTTPTSQMREAIANAAVGDDVFGDDPTVNELERRTAEVLGLESAIYMPTGTMANQISVRAHTEPGDEIFLHEHSHIYRSEAGGPAAFSGVTCNLLTGGRGFFSAETLLTAVRNRNIHMPRPRLLCVENTHNRGGGSVWTLAALAEVSKAARKKKLKVHLDGARLWNAAVALGVSEKEIVGENFDSVSVCFSKGLGAPVGSCLAGSTKFIERARRFRKMWGGGMRQAGIIAAGALYALEHHRKRLAEDHANAKMCAKAIADIDGIEVDVSQVETNIVFFRVSMPAEKFVKDLKQKKVLMNSVGPDMIRAVTSLMVTNDDVKQAANTIRRLYPKGIILSGRGHSNA